MDSYEDFARRARIMTEVHALAADDASVASGKAGGSVDVEGTKEAKKVKDAKKKSLKRL